ncbi:hypothetical protein, partial [Caballeronia arationis]
AQVEIEAERIGGVTEGGERRGVLLMLVALTADQRNRYERPDRARCGFFRGSPSSIAISMRLQNHARTIFDELCAIGSMNDAQHLHVFGALRRKRIERLHEEHDIARARQRKSLMAWFGSIGQACARAPDQTAHD